MGQTSPWVPHLWRPLCLGKGRAAEEPSKKSVVPENKHIAWFATVDGGVGLPLPMQAKTYQWLLIVQNVLTTMLPHHAGLNPCPLRRLHVDSRTLQKASGNILHRELLKGYCAWAPRSAASGSSMSTPRLTLPWMTCERWTMTGPTSRPLDMATAPVSCPLPFLYKAQERRFVWSEEKKSPSFLLGNEPPASHSKLTYSFH